MIPDNATAVACPACGGDGLHAVTYAFHSVFRDKDVGLMFDHYDWSDEYALVCPDCGWTHGDPSRPTSDVPLADALADATAATSSDGGG